MMKRVLLAAAIAAMAISAAGAYAQETGSAHPFIRIPRDPVTGAMAGAGAASTVSTAFSSFRNPATMVFSGHGVDIGLSYQTWAPQGASSDNIATGTAIKLSDSFAFGLGFGYDSGAGMDLFDSNGKPIGSFSPSDMVLNAGFGIRLNEDLGAGVSLRYSSDKGPDGTAGAFGADAFVLYRLMPDLNLSVGISSVGTPVEGYSGKSGLPTSLTLAGAYCLAFGSSALDLALDADYFLSGGFTAAMGVQYCFNDLLSLRAGYHLGSGNAPLPSYATVGAGVKFAGFRLDLSYLTANDIIGNTLTVGIGFTL